MYDKILVPLDGSESSKHALNHAISISERFGSRLMLLAVVSIVPVLVFPHEGFVTASINAAEDMARYQKNMNTVYEGILSETKEMMDSEHPDIETETLLREGSPASTIVEVAENDSVDLIVMGSRGIGGIMGWILGSTSHHVAENCTKPVLIVK